MTRTARTNIVALIIGVVFAACSARPAPQHATGAPSQKDGGLPTGRGSEIDQLDDQIAHDMAQAGLDVPSDDEVLSAEVSHSVPSMPMSSGTEPDIASTCEEPPSGGTCSDVCTLADSICSNADKICDIAADLGNDTHATQRCDAGKMSCDRAKDRCCGCD